MTLARSTDGGQTFKNYAWSTELSDPKDVFMGDYMGIAAYGGKVYGIWDRTATPQEQAASEAAAEPPSPSPQEKSAKASKAQEASNLKNELKPEEESGKEDSMKKEKTRGLFVEVGLADFSASPDSR